MTRTNTRTLGPWANVDAVLFDLDGVLTPTAALHRLAWYELFSQTLPTLGDDRPYTAQDYFAHVDGRPRVDGVKALLASRGVHVPDGTPQDGPGELTAHGLGLRKDQEFHRLLRGDPLQPYTGTHELLDALNAARIQVAVVSSSANARDVLAAAGLLGRFPLVVDGITARDLDLPGKPAPDMFEHAARVLGVDPDRCAVIEDATSGIQAAAAGQFATVIGVDRGVGATALREAGAHLVVQELTDLLEVAPAARCVPTLDRRRFPVDPWQLRETRFDAGDLGRTETIFAVGNGYLGMRANYEEGRDSHAHGTFINGFHETWPIEHAEDAVGFARVGQAVVHVPDTKTIRLYVDDEPLLLSGADLPSYERTLDLRDGVLRRDILWRTSTGNRVRVRTTRMVSLTDRHLAVMTYTVTLLDADAAVVISSQTLNRQDGQDEYHVPEAALGEGVDPRRGRQFAGRVLQPQGHWATDSRASLTYRCATSRMTLAVGVDHHIQTTNPLTEHVEASPDLAKHVYRIDARAGEPIVMTKLASYHTSHGVPARDLVERCERTLDRARAAGVYDLHDAQSTWLAAFWARSDVEVTGHDDIQQAIRWNLFQLAQAGARAQSTGISAKGVTGSGYDGHYFWDTEVYVLPFWTYTDPRVTRSALRFRYSMLDDARARARDLTQHGALFPWRTINGQEASAYYAAGTAQYHIDADVAYALDQYVHATGDTQFLAREAIDILVETARMWADLGFWRSTSGTDRFHIHGVTGPDEYTTVVNDNLFTNVMARFNLNVAATRVQELAATSTDDYDAMRERLDLRPAEVTEWKRAAAHMHLPYDAVLDVHPQDEVFLEREVWDLPSTPATQFPLMLNYHPLVIYRFQVLKQADVVMAMFLQGDQFTDAEKLANFTYYDPLTTGDSTLSGVAQSIVAAEVGFDELALEYFTTSVFIDLADLHHNTADGVHVAAAGGVWETLVHGFGGMRDHHGNITLDPRLPQGWSALTFRLTIRGTRLRVTVEQDNLTLSIEDGPATAVNVRGQVVYISPGLPATVPLDGQGPRLPGRPQSPALQGRFRSDGTVITSSVPHHAGLNA